MSKDNMIKFKNVGVNIFLFILAVALIFFAIRQQVVEKNNNKELTNEISQQIIDKIKNDSSVISSSSPEFSDFQSLNNLKKLEIVKNFESWTPSAQVDDKKIKKLIILDKGELSKGYIYIKTSINGNPLTTWESIYLKMNNEGGHMFRPNSLAIPQATKTEILFSLDNIYYLPSAPYSEKSIPKSTDWFKFFEDNKKIEFLSFVSSLKPAVIEEISLYYDCKPNSDCVLSVD